MCDALEKWVYFSVKQKEISINLNDIMLSGRNFGYAKYGKKESANEAIKTMHGQTVAGQRLKVLEAEPQRKDRDESNKRLKTDEFDD